jgi:hypothetical protein
MHAATPPDLPNPVLWTRSRIPAWLPAAYAIGCWLALLVFGHVPLRIAFGRGGLSAAFLLGGLLVLLALLPRRVEIGAEGIRIGWLFMTRTVLYGEIRRAEPVGTKAVSLTTLDGERFSLQTSIILGSTVPRAVLERLWGSIAAGAEEGTRGAEREALARSGRTTSEWLSALQDLGSPGNYRQAVFPPARLWAIAENPAVGAEVRAAAVVALLPGLDEPSRDRLRRISGATVEPQLQSALARLSLAGPHDHREIEAALEAVMPPKR